MVIPCGWTLNAAWVTVSEQQSVRITYMLLLASVKCAWIFFSWNTIHIAQCLKVLKLSLSDLVHQSPLACCYPPPPAPTFCCCHFMFLQSLKVASLQLLHLSPVLSLWRHLEYQPGPCQQACQQIHFLWHPSCSGTKMKLILSNLITSLNLSFQPSWAFSFYSYSLMNIPRNYCFIIGEICKIWPNVDELLNLSQMYKLVYLWGVNVVDGWS